MPIVSLGYNRALLAHRESLDADLVAWHLRIGWWSLALFGLAGLVLETLHAFKVGAYLDASNETRRLMWTLAHAHGTLLGVMHLGFAFTITTFAADKPSPGLASSLKTASGSLSWSSILLPLGFFLGGLRFYAGDPGVGIALVPVGAILVVYASFVVARRLGQRQFR